MSSHETTSHWAWIRTVLEAAGAMVFCACIGVGISLACFTAAETVADTRLTARKVEALQKQLDVLEAQVHARQAAAAVDAGGRGMPQTGKAPR